MKLLKLVALLLCWAVAGAAHAQDYPKGVVKLVIPFPPGAIVNKIYLDSDNNIKAD